MSDKKNKDFERFICIQISVLLIFLFFIIICSLIASPDFMFHDSDCQCNECAVYACENINHGDTCQCDKCLECQNIGG